jgi:hypothetical protein
VVALADLARAAKLMEAGDWEGAHRIVQEDESVLACWGHGIVHAMEGDLDNARYWYRRARRRFPSVAPVANEIAAFKEATAKRAEKRR